MCEYPLRPSAYLTVIFGTLAVILQSSALGLRALKGLRRSEWANLVSVTYIVPIEAFPVEWDRPAESGGGPIALRAPGEPVQDEPAFDPFCLMDEQPESGRLRPLLAPTRQPAGHWTRQEPFDSDPKIA